MGWLHCTPDTIYKDHVFSVTGLASRLPPGAVARLAAAGKLLPTALAARIWNFSVVAAPMQFHALVRILDGRTHTRRVARGDRRARLESQHHAGIQGLVTSACSHAVNPEIGVHSCNVFYCRTFWLGFSSARAKMAALESRYL